MDDARFDALTRRWETTLRSRRTLVRLLASSGLIAVLGRIVPPDHSEVAAVTRTHRRRSRPHAADADTAPRDTGLACQGAQPKGPVRGEPCGKRRAATKRHSPHGCCPGASCLRGSPLVPVRGQQSGWCFCDDGTEPDPEHPGSCRPVPTRCLLDAQACTSNAQCCQLEGLWCAINDGPTTGTPGQPDFYCGYDCAVVARDKPQGPCLTHGQASVPNCCRAEGFSCDDDCSCCGDLQCRRMKGDYQCAPPFCQTEGESGCVACSAQSARCASVDDCCVVGAHCAGVAPDKGEPRLCGALDTFGETVCCGALGQRCTDSCACCGSLTCQNGVCAGTCSALGARCDAAASCCPGGTCATVAVEKDAGRTCGNPDTFGKNVCCVLKTNNGSPCTSSCQCCGSLTCQDGVCVDAPPPPPPPCTGSICP